MTRSTTEELQRIKQQGVGGFLPEVTDGECAKAKQKMSGRERSPDSAIRGDFEGMATGYAETEENCKECEAKALLSACRAARLAYYRAGRGTPERASAIGKVQETERAADRFLGYTETEESCKGCMGPCGVCEDTKQSKSAILRGMFGYTDRGMGVTPRWEWTVQGGAEAYMKALEDRVRQLEFEREEVRKMRTVQKAFFGNAPGAIKWAALEESRRLEKWVDAALEPTSPTAATLFG